MYSEPSSASMSHTRQQELVSADCEGPPRGAENCEEMSFLRQPSPLSGTSLYEHLCDVVHLALADRAGNVMDAFEETSRMLQRRRRLCSSARPRPADKSDTFPFALKVSQELRRHGDGLLGVPEEDQDGDCGDVLAALQAASRAGVALPQDEALAVAMALDTLASNKSLTRIRFWGKVLGRHRDLLVAEAELTDDELDRRVDVRGAAEQAELEDPLNRKVYLVAERGAAWRELPPIRPRHILAARALDEQGLLFTGDPDAEVAGFPGGTEALRLHAQLVRISASCAVSPLGAYAKSPAVSMDLAEDECGVVRNADWLGVPGSASLAELADPGLAGWAHHSPCVLRSGRLALPQQMEDGEGGSSDGLAEEEDDVEEEEDDVQDDEDEEEDSLEEARPPPSERHSEDDDDGDAEAAEDAPLLCPLSQDAAVEATPQARCPSWTPRLCSSRLPQTATVLLRSNHWPGAVAYCSGRSFGHLYVGWGLKATAGPRGCPPRSH